MVPPHTSAALAHSAPNPEPCSHWRERTCAKESIAPLAEALGCSELEARLLITRGLTEADAARSFLENADDALHDPFLLPDMEAGAERLARAVRKSERVIVHGDYDVDGISSTALMVRVLQMWGVDARPFLPNRFEHGYGLSEAGATAAIEAGATLMVTVDCGTSSPEVIESLKREGIDTIVTDHHEVSTDVPNATALINPALPGASYPNKQLCGAGVAFKLLEATAKTLGDDLPKPFKPDSLLMIVALATVSDVMPLIGENRAIVTRGLAGLPKAQSPGLQALFQATKLTGRSLTTKDIGFRIGPCLNAAGRMGCPRPALDLFLARTPERASALVTELMDLNTERRRVQRETFEEAKHLARYQCDLDNDGIIVVCREGWHQGVIGIVASRLRETYHRPALCITTENGTAKGSGRSVPGFPLHTCLGEASELLERWGGHSQAVGFGLPTDQIVPFREAINEAAKAHPAEPLADPLPEVEAEITLDDVHEGLMDFLGKMEPFGAGNPNPVFAAREVQILGRPAVFADRHLKMQVTGPSRTSDFEAIMWSGAGKLDDLRFAAAVDMVFEPVWNDWQGQRTLRLDVKDVRPSG